jgi:3-methyladenine DNA glycosylase AlkD
MDTAALTRFVTAELKKVAVAENIEPMQAYLKTDMPFFGVKRPDLRKVRSAAWKKFKPADRDEYEAAVRALWALPRREEKYVALEFAGRATKLIGAASMPLYEQLIREGAWWDLVDQVATQCVSVAYLKERDAIRPTIQRWIDDDDIWIRRAALLAQLKHKDETDEDELFDFCRRRAHEKEFWIRKAIGWVLRQHARTNPDAVRAFLDEMGDRLSGLSRREAAKHL